MSRRAIQSGCIFVLTCSLVIVCIYCGRNPNRVPILDTTLKAESCLLGSLDRVDNHAERLKRYEELRWYLTSSSQRGHCGTSACKRTTSGVLNMGFVDPVLCRLEVLDLLLKGKYEDYLAFVAMHGKEQRIAWEDFHSMQTFARSLFFHFPGANFIEIKEVLEVALILLEVGKTRTAKELSWIYDISYDHEAQLLASALAQKPDMFPSVARLNPEQKKILFAILSFHDFDKLWRLEGGTEILEKLKKTELMQGHLETFELAFLLYRCYFMATFPCTANTFLNMDVLRQACHFLKEQSPERVFRYYLEKRAYLVGLDPESRLDLAVLRISALLDLGSREEGRVVKEAFLKSDFADIAQLIEELQFRIGSPLISSTKGLSMLLSMLFWHDAHRLNFSDRVAMVIQDGLVGILPLIQECRKRPDRPVLDLRSLVKQLQDDPHQLINQPFAVDCRGRACMMKAKEQSTVQGAY